MAERKYIDQAGLSKVFALIAGKYETKDTVTALSGVLGKSSLAEGEETVVARLAALENLAGKTSVKDQIEAAIGALAGSATSDNGTHVNVTVTTEDGEVKSVSVAETDIASAKGLADEIERATGKESDLQDAIDAEAEAARAAEKKVADDLADEVTRATGVEQNLAAAIGEAADADKAKPATGVYAYVDEQVATVNGAAEDLEEALKGLVTAEETRAKEAEKANADAIADMKDDSKEGSLAKQIADEVARAEKAEGDLQDAIDAEKERAEGAEGDLQDAIDAEAERATEAEKAITDRLDVIEGVGEGSIKAAVAAEEANRTAAIGTWTEGETAATGLRKEIEEKIADVNSDASALAARVKANEDALGVINSTDATKEGSIAKALADAKAYSDAAEARLLGSEELADSLDSIKDIVDYISKADDKDGVTNLFEMVTANGAAITAEETARKAAIADLDAEVTSTDGGDIEVKVTEVDGVITAVNVNNSFAALTAKEIQNIFEGKPADAENA